MPGKRKRVIAIIFIATVCFPLISCRKQEPALVDSINLANQHLDAGNPDQAINILEDLNARHPGSPEVLEALAFASAERSDFMLAAHYFRAAALSDPTRRQYLLSAGDSLEKAGKPEEAAKTYREYLNFFPASAIAWKTLGAVEGKLNHPREAIEAYLEGEHLNPSGESALRLGDLFRQLANTAQAREWYQTAVESGDGSEAEGYLGLLAIAMEERNFPLARKLAASLDAAFPGELDVSGLASAREELRNWQEEQEKLAESLREQKRLAREMRERAEAARKEAEAARQAARREAADKAASVPPPPPGPSYYLAEARRLRREGGYAEAAKAYWDVLQLNDSVGEVWYELSDVLLRDNQISWAEATALEAIRRVPEKALFALQYLKVAQKSKNPLQFLEELIKARKRLPDSPDLTLALARGYANIARNYRNAAILYKEFLALAPDSPKRSAVEAELAALPQP